MGRTGGYTKKTSLTGSEKKTLRAGRREFRKGAPFREQSQAAFSEMARGEDSLSKQIREQFGVGGKAYTSTEGFDQAKKIFEPVREEAHRQFRQTTLPEITNLYGRGSKASSALDQALASAASDLSTRLESQFAPLYQGERARQQELQLNTLGSLYGGQQNAAGQLASSGVPGAQIGLSKDQFAFAPRSRPLSADIALGLVQGASHGASSAATAGAFG